MSQNRRSRKDVRWLVLIFLLAAAPAFAQLSAPQQARIDSVFVALDKPASPGCVVGIGQNGNVLYQHAYGMANLEYDVPLTTSSILEIGSVSKQFTAASILLLAERGVLAVDDDIHKWIPEVPDFGSRITLRMMMNHTSGLRDQWGLLSLRNSPPGSAVHTLDLIVDLVSHQRDLNFPANDQYLYSNTNYALLAVVVQRAGGKSLAQFSQENIFQPLGMTHTQWRDDFTRVVKGRATAYDAGGRGGFHSEMPFTNVYGNGGLLTTAGDALLWWNALLNKRIGGPDFLDKLTTPGVLNSGGKIDYALGLGVGEYRGMREISHSGSTAGYRANLVTYPAEKTTIAVFCNTAAGNASARSNEVADVLFANKPAAPPPAALTASGMTELDIRTLVGLYRDTNTNDVVTFEARPDRLIGAGLELVPYASYRFHTMPRGTDVTVKRDGSKVTMEYTSATAGPVVLERVEQATPDATKLQEYVGAYWSPELETRYDVEVQNGHLVIRRRLMSPLTLNPTYTDAFTGGAAWVFSRDNAGRVNGMTYSSGRIRRLRFERMK